MPDDITDVVNDMAEAATDAALIAAEAEDPAQAAAEAAMDASDQSWEDQYQGAQTSLNESFSAIHKARGGITAASQRVQQARSALVDAEGAMSTSKVAVTGAIDSGIAAIDTITALLAQHRATLMAARESL